MIPYITKMLNKFPELIMGVASTPTADHLFKICSSSNPHCLPESLAIAYHHATAQLLFLSQVCHDIQTAVAFLTTRVKYWMRMTGAHRDASSNTSMGHVISNSHFLLNLFQSFACTWMLQTKFMMTVAAKLVLSPLLAQELSPVLQTNKNSTLKVLQIPNLS
jgi:hypothetical protein